MTVSHDAVCFGLTEVGACIDAKYLVIISFAMDSPQFENSIALQRSEPPRSPVCILVAEDRQEWQVKICHILRARPEWNVLCVVCDGFQAVLKATELRPDVVLLDIGMPRLNGIEAAAKIRQNSPGSRIIFVTQNSDRDIRDAALSSGAQEYVLKAQAGKELLPAIERALCTGRGIFAT